MCDLDLFTGIVAEKPLAETKPNSVEKGINGGLLNNVLGEFFRRAKCGDRYWYEFPDAEFTPGRLNNLFR